MDWNEGERKTERWTDLSVWDDVDAETDDHEEIERGRSNDGTGTEIASLEILGVDFDDGEKNLRSGRAKGHETQISHRFVPDADDDNLDVAVGLLDSNLLLFGRDDFDGAHEAIRHDGHANKQVAHGYEVDETASDSISRAQVLERPPHGDQEAILALSVLLGGRPIRPRLIRGKGSVVRILGIPDVEEQAAQDDDDQSE